MLSSLSVVEAKAILYPVTTISVICIPNSNKPQNPLYQEPSISKIVDSTKSIADSPVIKVKINANTKESGIVLLNKSVNFSPNFCNILISKLNNNIDYNLKLLILK